MRLGAGLCVASAALLQSVCGGPVAKPKYPSDGQVSKHLRPVLEKRETPQFSNGQPIDGKGKGGPISGTAICS